MLTQHGVAALRRAAVVVYDALANRALLDFCPADCERIFVGKSASHHTLTQDRINGLLVEQAQKFVSRRGSGQRVVVRLKGGDPYIFGRGGEEGQYLAAAGIPFAVIPGITSGLAGPAYAGIPVTHRELTSTVTLITGHEQEQAKGEAKDTALRVNYQALAALGGTLVFYMGVKNLPEICASLMRHGLSGQTPAAVIRQATLPQQQVVVGVVADIAQKARQAGIKAPAITVIGQVVSLRETLNWFERQPLFGLTVLVTRTRQQAGALTGQLTQLGARVLEAPTIEIAESQDTAPVDAALKNMSTMDCVVFTSTNGVEAAWNRLRALGRDSRALPAKVAAVGTATAAALERIGIMADVLPEEFIGEKIGVSLRQHFGSDGLVGCKVLLLRADIARPVLREQLEHGGAKVVDVPIYQTRAPAALPSEVLEALAAGEVQWITFTSASTVRNLHALLPDHLRPMVHAARRLSIGPITSEALRELDWPPTVEAAQHDIVGMVQALLAATGR
ncbi:MAG: uroporphyrinogen-III C-methyltransferase [Phycisphaerae bacterium]|nr:uroporphyrinogen-III C-methyltransferase [Phycisphaerae bacterium]